MGDSRVTIGKTYKIVESMDNDRTTKQLIGNTVLVDEIPGNDNIVFVGIVQGGQHDKLPVYFCADELEEVKEEMEVKSE